MLMANSIVTLISGVFNLEQTVEVEANHRSESLMALPKSGMLRQRRFYRTVCLVKRFDFQGEVRMETVKLATEKQIALLIQLGVEPEIASSLSRSQAIIAIKDRLNQPTVRQKIFLIKHGVPSEVIERMTKEEAKLKIGVIIASL
jgi:hypothetical protein